MIAVDANILARFYWDDPGDPEARRQWPVARRVMAESPAVFVPLTVVLELEWVMRGFYELDAEWFCRAAERLLGMPHVTVERWEAVKDAIDLQRQGFGFADAALGVQRKLRALRHLRRSPVDPSRPRASPEAGDHAAEVMLRRS